MRISASAVEEAGGMCGMTLRGRYEGLKRCGVVTFDIPSPSAPLASRPTWAGCASRLVRLFSAQWGDGSCTACVCGYATGWAPGHSGGACAQPLSAPARASGPERSPHWRSEPPRKLASISAADYLWRAISSKIRLIHSARGVGCESTAFFLAFL